MLAQSTITAERRQTARDVLTSQLGAAREAGAPPELIDGVVLSFEGLFGHRTRAKEPKNGALKRVRALSEGVAAGEPTRLSPDDAEQLVDQALAELDGSFA